MIEKKEFRSFASHQPKDSTYENVLYCAEKKNFNFKLNFELFI